MVKVIYNIICHKHYVNKFYIVNWKCHLIWNKKFPLKHQVLKTEEVFIMTSGLRVIYYMSHHLFCISIYFWKFNLVPLVCQDLIVETSIAASADEY